MNSHIQSRWQFVSILIVAIYNLAFNYGPPPVPTYYNPYEQQAIQWLGEDLYHQIQNLSGQNITGNNKLNLYIDGSEFYRQYLVNLNKAVRTIDLQTYLWCDDESGLAVANILAKKAKSEHVRVRIIADWMNFKEHRHAYKILSDAGIQILEFNKFPEQSLSKRMHEKIAILDGKSVMAGGANFCNEYLIDKDDLKNEHERKIGLKLWHDLVMDMYGPVARKYQEGFDRNWEEILRFKFQHHSVRLRYAHSLQDKIDTKNKKPEYLLYPPTPSTYSEFGEVLGEQEAPGTELAIPLWQHPYLWKQQSANFIQIYTQIIQKTKKRAILYMPYFIPHKKFYQAILKTLKLGKEVWIFSNSKDTNDMRRALSNSSRLLYKKLLQSGARIFEIKTRGMHAKALLIDNQYLMVGSNNFTRRSMRSNGEQMVLTNSQESISKFQAMVNNDIKLEYNEITLKNLPKVKGIFRRLWAKILAPWF